MSSATIVCNRQIGDKACGRPITPVFGAYPEECTTCAMRILVNTQEGREAFGRILDEHYQKLRMLAIAAAVPRNDWRVDGIELRQRFQMLEALEKQVAARRLMRSMNIAQRLSEKGVTKHEVRRVSLGHMWNSVSQDRAIKLKQAGFEVRFIGVGWQVKVS